MFVERNNIDKDYIKESLQKLSFIKNYNFEILQGGSKSVAVLADNYVIRFPTSQEALDSQKRESLIFEVLVDILPQKAVDIISQSKIKNNLSYQKVKNGKIISIEEFKNLSKVQKNILAKEIALFLVALHKIPTDIFTDIDNKTKSSADDWDFINKSEWNYNRAKKNLLEKSINLDDYKIKINNNDKVFCHNDLSGSNILIREKATLSALVDWGNAAIMPRSNEFVPFYKLSRSFAHLIIKYYNQYSNKTINPQEVDYKALSFIESVLIKDSNSWFANIMINNFLN